MLVIGSRVDSRNMQLDEATIDREAMGRLAKALAFICGADHPTTVALKTAAASGSERDIKNARTLFLRLKPSDRRAALAMLEDLARRLQIPRPLRDSPSRLILFLQIDSDRDRHRDCMSILPNSRQLQE